MQAQYRVFCQGLFWSVTDEEYAIVLALRSVLDRAPVVCFKALLALNDIKAAVWIMMLG